MEDSLGERSYFQPADYAVVAVMLTISMAIGIYYGLSGDRQRTSSEYILANRNMTFVPVTLSFLASYFSGLSLQGIPADVYYHGPMIMWLIVPSLLGTSLSLVFYLPIYYKLGLTSVYQYLELRFNTATKFCGLLSFAFSIFLYMGVVIYTVCVAATAVTGISIEVAVIGACCVCAVYTVIGGIKAVLWTDSLQMIFMIIAALAVVIKGNMELGVAKVWEKAAEGMRTDFVRFNLDFTDLHNGFAIMLGSIAAGSYMINNQYMVQRMVICKSEAVARASMSCFLVGYVGFMSLLITAGLTMFAYYDGCDPGTLGYTSKKDQILPYFINDVFGHLPGVPGLLLTGLFGAALSTVSSVLNAVAAVVGENLVKPFWKMKDSTYTNLLKIIVIVSSFLTIGTSFLIPVIGDALPVILTIEGATTGNLLALYILGPFVPSCGAKGAIAGYVVALVVAVVMAVGTILFNFPAVPLPLSADICLNETSAYLMNETSLNTFTMETGTMMYTSNVTQLADESGDDVYRPAIFTMAKIWIGFLTFLITLFVALLTTCLTGANDVSKLDPRLVVWKMESSSAMCDDGNEKEEWSDFKPAPQIDEEDESIPPKKVATRQTDNGNYKNLENDFVSTV